jgi:hypothetical protein
MGSQCQNSLYRLDQDIKALAFKAKISPLEKKIKDWHRRFGHTNY